VICKKIFLFACTVFFGPFFGFGQEQVSLLPEIVTIADRREALREKVGSSVTVVTREELENRREWFALEALRRTPGINVTRTGGPGQPAKLYMRGGEPRHVTFLVDGVEARDAAGFDGHDLVHLGLADV
ncbi:uncharacterized protein METZ01_LOCUS487472, partial [marine metagenome]